jgi:glycosyltransferase involved in cell wall biosynthesis
MPQSYVVITPARDEERTIGDTIRSMRAQRVKPLRWVVVNDGSTDATRAILADQLGNEGWVEILDRGDRGHRALGGGVVEAFYCGFERVRDLPWDYVVKLDADLCFGEDYFGNLLRRFRENPKLGIASGKTFLIERGRKRIEYCHDEHVRGPAKMYSRAAFEAIGGLEAVRGWDMIDETRAQMLGIETRSFVEEELIHLRPVDARQPHRLRSRYEMGKLYWYLGYHWAYHIVRCLRSSVQDPPRGAGGALLLAGYLAAAGSRAPRYDPDYVRFVRQKQRARMNLRHFLRFLRESRGQRDTNRSSE